MNKPNIEIREKFELFTTLVNAKKTIDKSHIVLDTKRSNETWLFGQIPVHHILVEDDIKLIVEKSRRDTHYGIKLRCKSLTGEPFFRFDSDGPAHRNDFPHVPLEEQSVSTPHFNTFYSNGKAWAYKTETLQREEDCKALINDINFGLAHFCQEANVHGSAGQYPTAVNKVPELEFEEVQTINFDQINFE